jgi:ubiquinone/menaquinone biosynthesis C-methylase UbiE
MPLGGERAQRFRWSLYAPVYDRLISFARQRRRCLELLALAPGERVLIDGCGTGLDLPLLPAGVEVSAIDLTPAMVRRAREKLPGADIRVGNALALDFPGASFDAVALHLIVAIVPDPLACLREARRVLKPGGRAVVFDKFCDGRPSALRRWLNGPARFFATDITRELRPLAAQAGFRIVHEEPAGFGGLFRIALLR